ncbi:PilZ domain-containing protein [Erythrobacter sanguineus]|jgi:hypothetical protein|uniref:PilZ domain-containing protein n=1 Tax=Erythrobacter sanguineus TaxID=198312 RepID=A0A1M7T1U1_9SPHN|nr:PilZ domain-containing protein [Erythrobacter sanguineus]SHN64678.1 PilZ domain-containing protein [Erythrobacter sanguineus]
MLQPVRPHESPFPRPAGRRSAPRLRLAIPVRLVATYATETCVLLDLSRSGARIGLARPLPCGDCAYLQIAGIEAFAEVVRRDPGVAGGVNGLVFDQSLPDAAVLAVRRHAETFEQREREAFRDQVRRWVKGESPA